MPPDVRKVVDQFKPSGNGKHRSSLRKPTGALMVRPEGDFDLMPSSSRSRSIRWQGLPYPGPRSTRAGPQSNPISGIQNMSGKPA